MTQVRSRTPPSENPLVAVAQQGVRSICELRDKVGGIFKLLSDGPEQDGADAATDAAADITPAEKFKNDLKERLMDLLDGYEKLEKVCALLPKEQKPFVHPVVMHSLVASTPAATHDFEALVAANAWLYKSYEYSSYGQNFLSNYQRRASSSRLFHRPMPYNANNLTTANQLRTAMQWLSQITLQIQRTYGDVVKVSHTPIGQCTSVYFITVGQVMRAAVNLRGLAVDSVNVKAFGETFYDTAGKLDTRSPSEHLTFRKVSGFARAVALQHCSVHMQHLPTFALHYLRQLIIWICQYRNLFSEPCSVCKRLLKDYLPPVYRDYRNSAVFHETCRP